MTSFLGLMLVLSVLVTVVMFLRASNADRARGQATGRLEDLEKRLTAAQEELNHARDEVKRKAAQVEEARDRAAKARKKDGKGEPAGAAKAPSTPDPVVMARFSSAVEAAERRAAAAEKELEAKLADARQAVRHEMQKEMDELRRRVQRAEQKEAAPAAAPAPAPEEKPEPRTVPGARVDVAKLEAPVVDELRRFYKRAVNAEKVLALTDGKLELAQDKLEETQRRYFAVCRELALAALNSQKPADISDQEAARLAMDMVAASEEASRRRQAAPRPSDRRAPRQVREGEKDAAPKNGDAAPREGRERRHRPHRHERREGEGAAAAPAVKAGETAEAKPAEAQPAAEIKPAEAKPAEPTSADAPAPTTSPAATPQA
ncbi:MAG: hypothetical protein HY904_01575 [Deltaproteobacteria bacterium]|nr:hypothetical protein [Deltaproteobacteria bacterium]